MDRDKIERKASKLAAGDVVVSEDGTTTTILNVEWDAVSNKQWVNFDNSLKMSFSPDGRFSVLLPSPPETGVDDLPDPPDWLAEENARRQHLKEQTLSGEPVTDIAAAYQDALLNSHPYDLDAPDVPEPGANHGPDIEP